jgi:NAD+ kinase
MTDIQTIGVLAHPLRPQSFPMAERIQAMLRQRDKTTWMHTEWQPEDVLDDVSQADLVVAIGGDGAMLRAARVGAPYNVPVLGVNMGQLGFLTEIADPEDCGRGIDRLLSGDYWIEERMMLQASIVRDGAVIRTDEALNDVVVSGGTVGRMIQIETFIDGDWATTYSADALVVATATGSTAYALACGGPILPPELKNILIVPAAPHLSMSRPIVLSEGARVDVRPTAYNRTDVMLNADGATLDEVKQGDMVRIHASDHITRFVRMRSRNYFYRSLLDRLEPRVPLHQRNQH